MQTPIQLNIAAPPIFLVADLFGPRNMDYIMCIISSMERPKILHHVPAPSGWLQQFIASKTEAQSSKT